MSVAVLFHEDNIYWELRERTVHRK